MKWDKIILFCFILVLFVGVVSAEEISGDTPVNLEDSKDLQSYDSNQKDVDDNAVESSDVESKNLKSNNLESNKIESTDKLRSEPEDDKSFTALNETVNSGSSEINMDHDYVFNNEIDTDFVSGIYIRDKTIKINGGNKVIDANNQADIFNIFSSNVIIENLKFINAKNDTLYIDEFSNVTTRNVIFENTGALTCFDSNCTAINVTFENTGALIYYNSNCTVINVTFENIASLTCQNSNYDAINVTFENTGILSYSNSNCTTINVTFENTPALVCSNSNYTSSNDKFINTYSDARKMGSAIKAVKSNISFDNIYFENKDKIIWSLIYTTGSQVKILNSMFNNLTSKYATILCSESGVVEVINSTFTNLTANLTAGAIGLKSCESALIENCTFINVSSVKNGGAIFADINGDTENKGTVLISNTLFDDCYSAFGGAYLQLGGNLTIMNSNFTDNCAFFDGGAVYTSYADVTILNSSFVNNCADILDSSVFHGAAILTDNGTLIVDSSNFTNNKIINGAAIYLYDSRYNITNSNFSDNAMALLTYFDKDYVLENNNFNGEEVSLNNTFYDFNALGVGHEIILNTTIINASATDAYLDLRKLNLTTPVKDQGHMGSCWAFGSAAAIEAAFLKATGIILDISENNLQDSSLVYSIYGTPIFFEGASMVTALSYCLSWLGVLPAEDDVYDELGKISPLIYDSDSYHVLDAIMIPARNAYDENQTADIYMQLKEALIKYGALAVDVNGDFSLAFNKYNATYHSVYCNSSLGTNHIVCLVGWDDTFPATHFTQEAPGDGAWIIKNSWGSDWGEDGYYYISYYDKNFVSRAGAMGYIVNNAVRYDAVYQYDVISVIDTDLNASVYRDVFVAEADGLLSAVGTYFDGSDIDYTVNIYLGDDLVYSQSGKSLWLGYHTIKLDKTISLTEGVTFAVEIESNSVPTLPAKYTREHFPAGVSFIKIGSEWIDISAKGNVASVKAYVVNATIVTNDLVKDFGDNNQFMVNITNPDKEVVFEINGKNYTVTSDKDGIATLEMNFNPGTYTVTTYYDNLSIINKVTIKDSPAYKWVTQQNQTIKDLNGKVNTAEAELKKADDKNKDLQNQLNNANNQITTLKKQNTDATTTIKKVKAASKVKKSKNFKITVTLKKAVKGKYVYVAFNGKSYKAKTNSKGVATITIKKSNLKKLAGKTIKYQVIYNQSLKNKSVKIKK